LTRFLAAVLLVVLCGGCHHRKMRKEQTQTADAPVTVVFSYSCALSPSEGFGDATVMNQTTLAEEKDRLRIHATGPDPQLGLSVTAPGQYAIRLDIESPVATLLELFYQVQSTPFSADHVLQSPLKPGRNQILLALNDPQFSGALRLDPGQVAGDYSIYSLEVFSTTPVSFARAPRSQADLAAAFNASSQVVLSSKASETLGKIKALKDVQLTLEANGLAIKATGNDPGLVLPECELSGHPIVKVVIVSPVATTIQMFYKTRDALDYDEGHSSSYPLHPGENTVYLEVALREAFGTLRLDPGILPGDYLLKEFEVRAAKANN
jgi:hypothetical protein